MEPTRGVYLPQIDVLRALAFFLVVIVHFTVPTWNAAISGDNIYYLVLGSVIKCGWFGVPIFLFVSGYSLALGKTDSQGSINYVRFYVNRLLRIYPLYILCISVIAYTHQLSGASVVNLALMQTQDIPKNSPFSLLWSIQLEFACYLLFPAFLAAIPKLESLIYLFFCLLLFRFGLYFLPTPGNWGLSYHSIFGGATLFLAGMCAAHYNIRHRLLMLVAVLGLILCSIFVTKHGGYGSDDVGGLKWFWIFFPEIFSIICYCLVGGVLSYKCDSALALFIAHIGKISYSGYVFHLFVLDFWLHFYGLPSSFESGVSFAMSFILYFGVLLLFSHVSYNSIELLFLRFRKSYF